MPDLFVNATAWLASQLTANASQAVTYQRGSATVSVNATRGQSDAEDIDTDGRIVTVRVADFLIDVSALILDGTAIEPKQGDRIVASDGTFRVMPAGGEGCFRRSGDKFRIHTKRVSS